jgi:hypothetical protein
MTKFIHAEDQIVDDTVEAATAAACDVLDTLFPGADNGGITSNFQGLLKRSLMEMIQGRTPRQTHQTHLPKLVMNGDDFGPATINETMFLPICVGYPQFGIVDGKYGRLDVEVTGLEDANGHFHPLAQTEDCFTSRAAAEKVLREWLHTEGCSIEQVRDMNILIAPVDFLDGEGFKVKDWYMNDVVEPLAASLPRPWERSKV